MLKPLLAALLISAQAAAPPRPGPLPHSRGSRRSHPGGRVGRGRGGAQCLPLLSARHRFPGDAGRRGLFGAAARGGTASARSRRSTGSARLTAAARACRARDAGRWSRGLMNEGAGADFARQADASLCHDANEIMEIASTLSPDQMARFVGAFASIADHVARMQAARSPVDAACPVPRPRRIPPRSKSRRGRRRPESRSRLLLRPRQGRIRPALTPFLCRQPE